MQKNTKERGFQLSGMWHVAG